jgi:hypothetical protein
MAQNKPANIRDFVWKAIDTDIAVRKDLSRNIVNVRALAQHIIDEYNIKSRLDAVVSAIRRYQTQPLKKADTGKAYSILKQAKITTLSKMAAFTLQKSEPVHEKIAQLLPRTAFIAGDILRVLEGSKVFRVIFDQKNYDKLYSLFGKQDIIIASTKLGMVEIAFSESARKVPGVFSIVSNELAENDISIIDAFLSTTEIIILVEEFNLMKSFNLIYNLCN